ncbi:alpha/beta hydrolase [Aliiroseovarius subalbicans]|uniref:alpha/beta hydrolase n=1 Tax=Aliiroseovarius subalbicans TaxID=2925840 RepID=UPI001F563F43|nr:alpha/beta hydrolase [Aliiroseovarius subalbicans]MCI2400151.1 alpha/beta hydrolase [Aliiroseovarius subalbicans]
MDYASLIDAETWAFIHKTGEYYPPEAVEFSISDQRRVYDTMCRAFFQGYPKSVSVTDGDVNGVPIRVYGVGAPQATVVYFHGGGFVVGGLDSHDDVCAEIFDRTGFRVVAVDYRLAPEHKHPAQFEDAWAATQYVALTWPGTIMLAGDSAGGNLAAAVAHQARGRINIAGQLLVYPALGGDMGKGSYVVHANAPMLTRAEVEYYAAIRVEGGEPTGDPTYAPLHDITFANLPPTFVITAECDPLADDGRDYCDRICAAGGTAQWHNEQGLIHGFLRARTSVTRARESFDRMIAALRGFGAGDGPN